MSNKFKIYRSSAGSGKTFTLTKEYIKLLLVSPSSKHTFRADYFRNILAITFTNDAANEMKARIVNQLCRISRLSVSDKDPFFDTVVEEIHAEYPQKFMRQELIFRATKVYEQLLHRYSDFSVSTIDAFSNRVVRSFTKDLHLPYNYDIQLDNDELLTEATDEILARVGKKNAPQVSDLLLEFARKNADESKNWNLEFALRDFGKNLFREENHELIRQLGDLNIKQFREIRQKLFAYQRSIKNQILNLGKKGFQLIDNQNINPKSIYYGMKGIYGYFQQKSDADKFDFTKAPNTYVLKTIHEDKWMSSKASKADEVRIDGIRDELSLIFDQIEHIRAQEQERFIIVSNILPHIYLLGIIHELGKQTEAVMRQKNQVHISEFNQKINQIIENEPVPYIYERLGERYQHILIDEFQDTSMMQWHNLLPLVINTLGFNHLSMIVGDAKQSIYRWRGGNAALIVNLPQVPTLSQTSALNAETEILKAQASPQSLDRNWRSKENIVRFNNQFFEWLRDGVFGQEYKNLSSYYQEVKQNINPNQGGHVELTLLNKAHTEAKMVTLGKVLEIISNLTRNYKYQYQDITILTRTNEHASYLAEELIKRGIQVISSESLLLTSSQKVTFVVNFIRILAQPLNPIAKSELLYFIYGHFNTELNFDALKVTGEIHMEIARMSNQPKFSELMKYIKTKTGVSLHFRALQYLSIYEIAEELIRVFQLNHDSQEQIYLQKLLDVMLDFSWRKAGNLSDFIEYWDRNAHKISVSTPQTGNAVRIMTIHKSKGLEFSVVILPFADWAVTPKNTAKMWVNWENKLVPELKTIILPVKKDLLNTKFADAYMREREAVFLDAINMLYVALTRPTDKLFIIGSVMPQVKEVKNIAEILKMYVQSHLNVNADSNQNQDYWQYTLYHDQNCKAQKSNISDEQNYILSHFISTECRDKLRMRRDDLQKKAHRISIAELYSERKQGVLIHKAFEYIRFRTDVPKAVKRLVHDGLITVEEYENLCHKIQQVVDLPSIKHLFEKSPDRKIRNERDFFICSDKNKNMPSRQVYRPDRVIFEQQKVTLIDYKTGQKSETHHQQINEYALHFQNIGFTEVTKFLVYTEIPEAVLVD